MESFKEKLCYSLCGPGGQGPGAREGLSSIGKREEPTEARVLACQVQNRPSTLRGLLTK